MRLAPHPADRLPGADNAPFDVLGTRNAVGRVSTRNMGSELTRTYRGFSANRTRRADMVMTVVVERMMVGGAKPGGRKGNYEPEM